MCRASSCLPMPPINLRLKDSSAKVSRCHDLLRNCHAGVVTLNYLNCMQILHLSRCHDNFLIIGGKKPLKIKKRSSYGESIHNLSYYIVF